MGPRVCVSLGCRPEHRTFHSRSGLPRASSPLPCSPLPPRPLRAWPSVTRLSVLSHPGGWLSHRLLWTGDRHSLSCLPAQPLHQLQLPGCHRFPEGGRPFPSQLALLPPGRGGQLQAEEGSAGPGPSPVLSRGSELGSWGPTAQPEAKARSFSVSRCRKMQGRRQLLSDLQARSCRSWGSGEGLRYPQLARGRD